MPAPLPTLPTPLPAPGNCAASACLIALLAIPAEAMGQQEPFQAAPLPADRPWRGASERLVAKAGDPWITPAEASGFVETPDYAATRAWLEKLVAASPLLRIESFGTSPEGRDLYTSAPAREAPSPSCSPRAAIHSGEIDGKDAGLMLLRDIGCAGRTACSTRSIWSSCRSSMRWA